MYDLLGWVGCFLAGMLFKRYVLDVLRGWIIKKMAPGIIQTYLEDMLGMNKKSVLPPVVITPVVSVPSAPLAPSSPAPAVEVKKVPDEPVMPMPVMPKPPAPVV
jgi:hypothetical protein